MRRSRITASLAIVAALSVALASNVAAARPSTGGLYPDLRAVVPQHLQLVNSQQREILRFSNGVANTGAGHWAMRPDPPPSSAQETVSAIQEIRDSLAFYQCGEQPKQVTACYNIVREIVAGVFAFHPEHNHWHIGDVAGFEVRKGSPTGPVTGGISVKTTFCLIDLYKLDGNSPTSEKVFWDCYASYQGVSSGWVDQYHQSTEGQQLDITGIPNADDYYLVTTTDPTGIFTETDRSNNSAWTKFRLYQDSNGNRKIEVLGTSPCDSPGLCGTVSANR